MGAAEPLRLARMEEAQCRERLDAVTPRPGVPAIEFDNVCFSYPLPGRSPALVLNGVSLTVNPSETVAVLGPSGSGKSTILQLLHGFYNPDGGIVRVFGCDIASAKLESLYSVITSMQQRATLFSGRTVRENISYSDPEIDIKNVESAARKAGAHDFITQLPQGYDSVLDGEEDGLLSGGQLQRITLARALISDAKILLLDEPTSALHATSAEHVEHSLAELLRERSALLVTHDTGLARRLADRVIVLGAGGTVLEQGSPQHLIELGGAFATLCEQQASTEQWSRVGEPPGSASRA